MKYHEYCFRYKAPKDIPKYEIGKVQWKLFHEERKRQKKAKLSASIEHERAFFVGLGEMENRQRVGIATGQPPKKGGKMSLFDAVMQGI